MPHFAVHEGYAVYEGPATDSSFHMHAAFQVAIAVRGEVLMVDASGTRHQAVALIVRRWCGIAERGAVPGSRSRLHS
ncbi:hypothetical protein BLA24_06370 [Streptomyces cinnamoneus]|uniref:Uncharacterized protein n=1 Tax=Streptomyces cinnamoneus TaxID=53446 RepID=A0A2G1XNA9_STRCJ|nr:hypothetical protein [Streptomyces cinnamoneus]PHQ52639.1 hypothetical protein BLA24_06370 [Streptomyces cinnamoneus]